MKIVSTLFFVMITAISTQIYAHGDHNHTPISVDDAFTLGGKVATELSKRDAELGFGKLPESWSNISNNNISMHKQGKGYYIVSLLNTVTKKTLYVLMSNAGDIYDANFTGEFEGIN